MNEYICQECDGSGKGSSNSKPNRRFPSSICERCAGSGKLDWIDNVLGSRKSYSDILRKNLYEYVKGILEKYVEDPCSSETVHEIKGYCIDKMKDLVYTKQIYDYSLAVMKNPDDRTISVDITIQPYCSLEYLNINSKMRFR